MFVAPMIFMSGLPPSNPNNMIKRIYGEWVISHCNHPLLSSINSKIIEIYPRKKLILSESCFLGPFLYSTKMFGKFKIDCNENGCILENDDEDVELDCKLDIMWYEKKFFLESIFGIGVNEIETQIFYERVPDNLSFSIDYINTNFIYMSNDDKGYQLNLVRNSVPKTKRYGTPLSTFIFAQIFGSVLVHILHNYFTNFI